jgi:hypothetical protein
VERDILTLELGYEGNISKYKKNKKERAGRGGAYNFLKKRWG